MRAGAIVRWIRIPAAVAVLAAAQPRPALAQSWGLGWLKAAEEWSMQEDYRGWIFHGAIAALVTLAADWVAGKPEYGAAIGSGFYIGKEIRETQIWQNGFDTDRVMDLASPVIASGVTAFLLKRNDEASLPRLLPTPFAKPCPMPREKDDTRSVVLSEPVCLALRSQQPTRGDGPSPQTADALHFCWAPPRKPVPCAGS